MSGNQTPSGNLLSEPSWSSGRSHGSSGQPMTIEQVGQFLLSRDYYLTALELLVEAEETGHEKEITLLRDFFRNAEKFNPQELAKFQGEDALSVQSLAREREERLSVSEYELRLAKEDAIEMKERLRAKAQEVTEQEGIDSVCAAHRPSHSRTSIATASSLDLDVENPTQRDLAELNSLVCAHLLQYGYQVTALTLQEEARGLISCKTPRGEGLSLWQIMRNARTNGIAQEAAEVASEQLTTLQEQFNDLLGKYTMLQERHEAVRGENQLLRGDIQILEKRFDAARAVVSGQKLGSQVQASETADVMPTEANEPGAGCRPPPELSSAESGRDCSTSAPAGYDYSHWGPIGSNALRVVTDTLPQILPNVLINKRQEIVPVIIALIQENPVKADRENLARLLFNLVKKPHLEQRKVIISGCISLATVIGPQRTADELMPQMWEQLGHKYPERRALLAEAVGALAGLVDDNVRASAILSILHKLSSDTESDVRLSVVPSMVQLLDFLSPGNKHWMVEEVLFRMVMDRSDVVVSSTFEALLPATLAWAKTMENVYSKLVLNTATHMVELIEDSPYPATTEFGLVHRGEAEMHIPRESQQRKIFCLLSLYTTLIPYVRSSALQHCPSWVNVEPQVEHSGPSEDGGKHTLAHNSTKDSGEGTADSVPEMPLGSEDGAKNNPFLRSPLVETNGAGPGDNPFEADLNNNLLLYGKRMRDVARIYCEDSGKPGSNPFLAGNPPVVDATTNPFATKDEQFRVRRSSSAPETNPFVELESQDGEGANPAFTDQQGHGHNTALGHTETNPFLSPKAQSHQPPVPMRSMSSPFSLSGDEGVSGQGGDVSSGLALGGSLAEDEICRKFGQWVEGPNDGSWEEVDMMACQVVPLLIRCCRGVAPLHECDRLRRRLVAAMKLTCGSFGESFTVSAVEPLFVASASIPTCASRCPVAHKVEGIVPTLIPTTLEGTRVGHIALLPVFLAAVLVQSGKGRLSSYIRKLLSDGPEDDTWVLQHRKEFTAAVQFASAFEDVKCHLLGALKDSARSPNPLIKKGVAALVEGLAGTVSAQEVTDTLLPVLASLSSHSDLAVQVTSLGAMQRVSIICSDQPTVVQRLHSQFDAMICEGAHDVQIAVLQTLTMAASQAMVHVEFLLKEILFLLARIQQRSVAGKSYLQLKELAGAAFQALQTLDTCQVKEHSTRLHLLAAMEALNREAPLLEQTQKQLLSAMLRDHSDHTPAMVVPQLAPNPATPRTPRTPKTPKTPRTPKAFLGRSSSMENEQETAGRPAPNHSRVRSAEDAVHGSMFGRGKPAKGTGWHFELPRLPQTNTFL